MFNPIKFERGEEFDYELQRMAGRARAFDSCMVFALWRILHRYNDSMDRAIESFDHKSDFLVTATELLRKVEEILPPLKR